MMHTLMVHTSAKMRIFENLVRKFIFDLKFLSETERA